jgi:hypothetical protein
MHQEEGRAHIRERERLGGEEGGEVLQQHERRLKLLGAFALLLLARCGVRGGGGARLCGRRGGALRVLVEVSGKVRNQRHSPSR